MFNWVGFYVLPVCMRSYYFAFMLGHLGYQGFNPIEYSVATFVEDQSSTIASNIMGSSFCPTLCNVCMLWLELQSSILVGGVPTWLYQKIYFNTLNVIVTNMLTFQVSERELSLLLHILLQSSYCVARRALYCDA